MKYMLLIYGSQKTTTASRANRARRPSGRLLTSSRYAYS
jgi:hypothetical protein